MSTDQIATILTSRNPVSTVRVIPGDEPPNFTAGYGGWESVSRPQRAAATVWRGYDARAITLTGWVDGWRTQTSVEGQCRTLEAMARPADNQQPLEIRVAGPGVPPAARTLRWVIQSIGWGDVIRADNGTRYRQQVTIELVEVVNVDVDVKIKRKPVVSTRMVTAKKGDTIRKIATRVLSAGRAAQIAKLNPKLPRDVNKPVKAGTKIRVPVEMTVAAVSGRLAGVNPVEPVDVARAVAVTFNLQDQKSAAWLTEAVTGGRITRTIDGASTLVLDILDADRALLQSTLATTSSVLRVQGKAWRLVRVSGGGTQAELTFEPQTVAQLRARKTARTVSGTRIQAMEAFAREVGVKVISPTSKVAPSKKDKPTNATPVVATPGFSRTAKITVKGAAATPEQRSVASQVLTAAWSVLQGRPSAVKVKAMVGTIMAATQESSMKNLKGGDRDSQGVFQQRPSSGYKHIRDVPLATKDFLLVAPGRDAFLASMLKHPDRSLGWCISDGQRDYTWGTSKQGADYDQWRAEAERTVNAWLGGVSLTDGAEIALKTSGTFSRDYGEQTWECLQRLAQEVKLRCFERDDVLYICDDAWLLAQAGDVVVTPDEPWVLDCAFDFDVGMPQSECRVRGLLDGTRLHPGRSTHLDGYGPADGRWLIRTVEQQMGSAECDVTLYRPQAVLPEPKDTPEATTASPAVKATRSAQDSAPGGVLVSSGSVQIFATNSPGMVHGGINGDWAGSGPICESLAAVTRLPISSRKRSTVKTDSGNVSDHYRGNTNSYACDCAAVGSVGDQALARLMAVLGRTDYKGGYWLNINVGGYRIQVGWRVKGHYTHIHIGVRRL